MSNNPYCYVSAEMRDFKPVSTSLVARLVQKGANSVRLYGYRGAGKTATLQAVAHQHEQQGDSVPVYVNLNTEIDGPIKNMTTVLFFILLTLPIRSFGLVLRNKMFCAVF